MTQAGNSQTRVCGSVNDVRKFAKDLVAADKAERLKEIQHVIGNFEQSAYEGPWRIIVSIVEGD